MPMASHLHLIHGKLIISYNNNSLLPIFTRPPLSSSSSYRPMSITATTTSTQSSSSYNNYWAVIEGHMKKSITIRPPVCVFEPMHRLTFAAPKSRAPPLCMAACELVGGSPEDAVTAASAIHLMHAAAYTHHHLPLTDRPRRPTVPDHPHHHLYDPNIELLLPDGMVPYGFEILGRSSQHNPDRILRVIIEISGSQLQGINVDNEMMMMINEEEEEEEEYVCELCEKKELHGCAAACGAILGGGSDVEIQMLRKFGVYVGIIQGILVNGGGVGKNKLNKLKDKAVQQLGPGLFTNKLHHISSLLD